LHEVGGVRGLAGQSEAETVEAGKVRSREVRELGGRRHDGGLMSKTMATGFVPQFRGLTENVAIASNFRSR
jgi:hypothetical protein